MKAIPLSLTVTPVCTVLGHRTQVAVHERAVPRGPRLSTSAGSGYPSLEPFPLVSDPVISHWASAQGHRSGTLPGRPTASLSMNDVTRILSAIEQGDPHAAEQL